MLFGNDWTQEIVIYHDTQSFHKFLTDFNADCDNDTVSTVALTIHRVVELQIVTAHEHIRNHRRSIASTDAV